MKPKENTLKTLVLIFLLVLNLVSAQNFSKTFDLPYSVVQTNAGNVCAATSDGFLNAFTIYQSGVRNGVIVTKLNQQGEHLWSKEYNSQDAAKQIQVSSVVVLAGDAFILGGQLTSENNPGKTQLTKFDNTGEIVWSKIIDNWGSDPGLSLLSDGSILFTFIKANTSEFCLVKLNAADGTIQKTMETNLISDHAHFIHTYDGNFTMVLSYFNIVNFDNDLTQINFQKKYYTEIGFAVNKTSNGDFIFATATGFPAHMTVFRTNHSGALRWSKHIQTWRKDKQHDQSGDFDIVGFHLIKEDSEGNIEVVANSEGGAQGSLCVKLSANGDYIGNRKLNTFTNKILDVSNDEYYIAGRTNPGNDKFSFSKHKVLEAYECDEELNYTIENASDLERTPDVVSMTTFSPVWTDEALIKVNEFTPTFVGECFPLTTSTIENLHSGITISPNPAREKFLVELNDEVYGKVQLLVLNAEGKCVYEYHGVKARFNFQHEAALGSVPPGIYFTTVVHGGKREVIKLVVQ